MRTGDDGNTTHCSNEQPPKGHVRILDPDKKNINSLSSYICHRGMQQYQGLPSTGLSVISRDPIRIPAQVAAPLTANSADVREEEAKVNWIEQVASVRESADTNERTAHMAHGPGK